MYLKRGSDPTQKIVVGMAVYGANPETFSTALRQARIVADRVHVVYGRWKGFDAPDEPFPEILKDRRRDPTLWVTRADRTFSQGGQRDLYLKTVKAGDILIVWDPDMTLKQDPIEVREFLLNLDNYQPRWSAILVESFRPDGNNHEQSTILVYRFHRSWRHRYGSLINTHGTQIAAPNYKILRCRYRMSFIHHRDQSDEYRQAQAGYWAKVEEGENDEIN